MTGNAARGLPAKFACSQRKIVPYFSEYLILKISVADLIAQNVGIFGMSVGS